MFLDESESGGRVPRAHDDDRSADRELHLSPEAGTRVVRGTDEQVHVIGAELPTLARPGDPGGTATKVVGTDRDTLRPPGGSRGVGHRRRPRVTRLRDRRVLVAAVTVAFGPTV